MPLRTASRELPRFDPETFADDLRQHGVKPRLLLNEAGEYFKDPVIRADGSTAERQSPTDTPNRAIKQAVDAFVADAAPGEKRDVFFQIECPITLNYPDRPVILKKDGQTYNRPDLTQWFKNHQTTPFRQPVTNEEKADVVFNTLGAKLAAYGQIIENSLPSVEEQLAASAPGASSTSRLTRRELIKSALGGAVAAGAHVLLAVLYNQLRMPSLPKWQTPQATLEGCDADVGYRTQVAADTYRSSVTGSSFLYETSQRVVVASPAVPCVSTTAQQVRAHLQAFLLETHAAQARQNKQTTQLIVVASLSLLTAALVGAALAGCYKWRKVAQIRQDQRKNAAEHAMDAADRAMLTHSREAAAEALNADRHALRAAVQQASAGAPLEVEMVGVPSASPLPDTTPIATAPPPDTTVAPKAQAPASGSGEAPSGSEVMPKAATQVSAALSAVAARRLQQEMRRINKQAERLRTAGLELSPLGDNLSTWEAKLYPQGDGKLATSLAAYAAQHQQDHIVLHIEFPSDYPQAAPKVFIKSPRLTETTIISKGAVCMDMLLQNWTPNHQIDDVVANVLRVLQDSEQGIQVVQAGKPTSYSLSESRDRLQHLKARHDQVGWKNNEDVGVPGLDKGTASAGEPGPSRA